VRAEPALDANQRWASLLGAWAIPAEIIGAVLESPYFFDPLVFVAAADEAIARTDDSPSDRAAREVLPQGGRVLDVGVGAGAASVRLRPASIVGVDANRVLLDAFVERASRLGIDAVAIEGNWPAVAPDTPVADVVVCHHVVYNAADLAAFAAALNGHARRRVVVELTAVHPMAWLAPYWQALHGIDQPDRPTVADAVDVLRDIGTEPHQERWLRNYQMIGENGEDALARIARRLCLPPDRHAELRELLVTTRPPMDREVVTMWWD
jgi:SAM-dependent methyltransferase